MHHNQITSTNNLPFENFTPNHNIQNKAYKIINIA